MEKFVETLFVPGTHTASSFASQVHGQLPLDRLGESSKLTVVECTDTVNEQVFVLPDASVAVHRTVVVPQVNNEPGEGLQDTVTPGQLSFAMLVGQVTVACPEASAQAVMLDGQVIVGGSGSYTVTVCLHEFVLPEVSVTVHVTVLVPFANWPGALFSTLATPQLSAVIGVPRAIAVAKHWPASVRIVMFDGHVIVGGS